MIARAPLRISFAGGGTDLPAYSDRYGGMVVSAAITRYARATIGDETMQPYPPLVAACIDEAAARGWCMPDLSPNLLHVSCDVEPGTGLGSSSAACCAALRAIAPTATAREIADAACRVEIDRLSAPIGTQDQYASAFGGLNALAFAVDGTVQVIPLALAPGTLATFERRLLLYRDGTSRRAGAILRAQQERLAVDDGNIVLIHHSLVATAFGVKRALLAGDLDRVGALLHQGWMLKRELDGVTTDEIDTAYHKARQAGAGGGKLCGAGGGGHLLLYAREETHPAIDAALTALGLVRVPFAFEPRGACVER